MACACEICQIDVGEAEKLECANCKCWQHYVCAKMKACQFKRLDPEEKRAWLCVECVRSAKEAEQTAERVNSHIVQLQDELKRAHEVSAAKWEEMSTSQSFLSSKYDEMLLALNKMGDYFKKIQNLEAKVAEQDKELKLLRKQVQEGDQYGRRRQLEFHGIRKKESENLEQIVSFISNKIDVKLKPGDIDAIHRVPRRFKNGDKPDPDPVLVEFTSRKVRDQLLENKKKMRMKEDLKDIKIFESLSPYHRDLLWKTKLHVKDKNYKYVWFQRNKVLVKKNRDAEIVAINQEIDLSKIV